MYAVCMYVIVNINREYLEDLLGSYWVVWDGEKQGREGNPERSRGSSDHQISC